MTQAVTSLKYNYKRFMQHLDLQFRAGISRQREKTAKLNRKKSSVTPRNRKDYGELVR